MSEEGQHAPDQSVRPISEGLTQLLSDPWLAIQDAPAADLKPSLYDKMLRWFSVAMFGAAAVITGAALTARLLP